MNRMRSVHGFALAGLLFAGLASHVAAAADSAWPMLDAWIGRYPGEPIARGQPPLLRLPALQGKLAVLLSEADRRKLALFTVEQPATKTAGLLVTMQCMPHNCGDQNAMVVIDPTQRRMWIGFFSRSPPVVSTRWFGDVDTATLPAAVLEQFAAQHTP